MESQTVFEKGWELDRLTVQNQLLRECELPVYQKLLEGKSGLRLLDVGCNDGSKTMDRFDLPQVERIMGLEYNEGLARRAQEKYGGGKASFHSCDLEDPDFPVQMAGLMEADGIEGFDLIYISFVLMHLKRPDLMLARLRRLPAGTRRAGAVPPVHPDAAGRPLRRQPPLRRASCRLAGALRLPRD